MGEGRQGLGTMKLLKPNAHRRDFTAAMGVHRNE